MATSTSYLQLHKPEPPESINEDQDLNDNYTIIEDTLNSTELGWHYIDKGENSSGSFVIDLTKSGQFPAGTFNIIKVFLTMLGGEDGLSSRIRVNSDQTLNLHEQALVVFDPNGGTVQSSTNSNAQAWIGPELDGSTKTPVEITMYETNVSSRIPTYIKGFRSASTNTERDLSLCSGGLTSNRLINSLEFFGIPIPPNLGECKWRAIGFKV